MFVRWTYFSPTSKLLRAFVWLHGQRAIHINMSAKSFSNFGKIFLAGDTQYSPLTAWRFSLHRILITCSAYPLASLPFHKELGKLQYNFKFRVWFIGNYEFGSIIYPACAILHVVTKIFNRYYVLVTNPRAPGTAIC